MSLYADEDLAAVQDIEASSTVSAPSDPLQALAAALTCPAESIAQAEALVAAGQRFEKHPERLPELCGQLLPMVVDGGESLLRSWTLDMVALAVGRSGLKVDVKLAVAQSSLDALNRLLASDSVTTIKAVIPIFSTIYPVIFKLLATSRPPQVIFDLFQSSKARILDLVLNPHARPQSVGIKAAGWKFVQRVLLVGTRAASSDPRLAARNANSADPSISIITPDSPLDSIQLEKEAEMLRTQLITQLYSADDPAILHPIINTLPVLCKSRPALAPLIVSSITTWTPAAMMSANRPAMQVRAVEKTMKCVTSHLVRHPPLAAYSAQFKAAMIAQKGRMEPAYVIEQEAREARRAVKVEQVLGKHSAPPESQAESSADAAKRAKLEAETPTVGLGIGKGPEIDVTSLQLPLQTVIELVIANLETLSEEILNRAFENARRALLDNTADAQPLLAVPLGVDTGRSSGVKDEDLDEILNPLEMDLEDDEDLLLAAQEVEEAEEVVTFADFILPPPEPLDPAEKENLVDTAVKRIWTSGDDLASLPNITLPPSDGVKLAVQPKEMWMLLLARLTTRGADVKRKSISDFVVADFSTRSKFASIWLNEEWYNEKLNTSSSQQYNSNLEAILATFLPKIDGKDKSLAVFLTSLPELPLSVITMLESLCVDPERSIVGFLALRDLVETRPPVRQPALNALLELCTHDDRKIRVLAISTVRRWVPGSAMSNQVVDYAKGVLRRLAKASQTEGEDVDMKPALGEENEQTVSTRFLKSVSPETVQQHVELFLALSRRHQPLLDQIFQLFPRLTPAMQDALEPLFTPLIQSLGASEKLLDILKHFPIGADRLALRVVSVLSDEGRKEVVGVVKGLMVERELDPRFIIPIIGQLDKGEIVGQVPRIVSLLADNDNRDLVRTAFASALQKMTPADLLVSLHNEETALKQTIEAIGLCFSMTTVFRSDVLATAMSRIADLPSLPIVFIRTIIQAVSTYKSLTPFVANHIFPKLIAKKIWENPQLWDGFVRLARRISPACFGALMQVPKEWLKDLVDKQPAIRGALKGFLAGKPGTRDVMYEIFGDE